MKGCLGAILSVLALIIASGLWGWHTQQAAADAYQQGPRERVPATIVSAQMLYAVVDQDSSKPHDVCQVKLLISDQTITRYFDILGGACDDNTPLRPGVSVEAEYWKGSITAIYFGTTEYLANGNPALSDAVPQAQIFFAGLLAIPVVALLILDVALGGLVKVLRRRGLLPKKRASRLPPSKVEDRSDFTVYPPE